ncbi:hypothetical protein HK104_000517 [Borealophlyctis nickersoniae]|nr:hypothetical protein HK104_000517 [Borealophlyctis nickersoniae]
MATFQALSPQPVQDPVLEFLPGMDLTTARRESDAALKAAAIEVLRNRFSDDLFVPPQPIGTAAKLPAPTTPRQVSLDTRERKGRGAGEPSKPDEDIPFPPLRVQQPPLAPHQRLSPGPPENPTPVTTIALPSTPVAPSPSLSLSPDQIKSIPASSELTAFALTTLFAPRTSFQEALASLTPTQLQLLERSVERVKQLKGQDVEKMAQNVSTAVTAKISTAAASNPSLPGVPHLPINAAASSGSSSPAMSKAAAEAFVAAMGVAPPDPRTLLNLPFLQQQQGMAFQQLSQLYGSVPLGNAAIPPLPAQAYMQALFNRQAQTQVVGQGVASQSSSSSPLIAPQPIASKTPTYSSKKPQKPALQSSSSSAVPRTMPGTVPQSVELRDGVEWVTFSYTVKGNTKVYTIRTDIDRIQPEDMSLEFKTGNCVYPRAYCDKTEYTGNRWEYENSVNELGWKLTYLNQGALAGRRGLIQRAVDSYRNRFPELRSRRVVRQEKLIKGTLRKRPERPTDEEGEGQGNGTGDAFNFGPPAKRQKPEVTQNIEFESICGGKSVKTRIRVDLHTVDLVHMPEQFRKVNAVFPRAVCGQETFEGPASRWEREREMNELAWKLAWLNPRLSGKRVLLQRALDSYREHFTDKKPRTGKVLAEDAVKQAAEGGRRGKATGKKGGKAADERMAEDAVPSSSSSIPARSVVVDAVIEEPVIAVQHNVGDDTMMVGGISE